MPATGKTTLARELVSALHHQKRVTLWLDSDDLRRVLTPNPRYTDEERDQFYEAIAHLAVLGVEGGSIVIVSATAPFRRYRDELRARVDRFIEIWLRCDVRELEERDPKGLYAAARRGEVTRLPGVGAPYEVPHAAELVFDTDKTDLSTMTRVTLDELNRRYALV